MDKWEKSRDELLKEDQLEEKRKKISMQFYSTIAARLRAVMNQQGLTEADIQKRCLRRGFRITTGAISKLLSNQVAQKKYHSITLINFIQVCQALHTDPVVILARDFTLDQHETLKNEIAQSSVRSHLIFDTEDDAYWGHLGDYHCYFYPTISGQSKLLHGRLTFQNSPLKDYCEAYFTLYTNQCDEQGLPIKKEYTGELIISDRLDSCYCLLHNTAIGELCLFIFNHLKINNEKLVCRLATVVTTSAGNSRRPCMHRMLINRDEIPEKDLELLKAQLLLNNSDIMISEKNLERLLQENPGCLPPEVLTILNQFTPQETYYHLSEYQLKGLGLSRMEEISTICLLRNYSTARKNNKIGTKSDELIFDYLTEAVRRNQSSPSQNL